MTYTVDFYHTLSYTDEEFGPIRDFLAERNKFWKFKGHYIIFQREEDALFFQLRWGE